MAFVNFGDARSASPKVTHHGSERRKGGIERSLKGDDMRVALCRSLKGPLRTIQAGVTAYLLHNGSATYILWQA